MSSSLSELWLCLSFHSERTTSALTSESLGVDSARLDDTPREIVGEATRWTNDAGTREPGLAEREGCEIGLNCEDC